MSELGNRVRAARAYAGDMSQKDLSGRLPFSLSTLQRIEAGGKALGELEEPAFAEAVAKATGLPPWFFTDDLEEVGRTSARRPDDEIGRINRQLDQIKTQVRDFRRDALGNVGEAEPQPRVRPWANRATREGNRSSARLEHRTIEGEEAMMQRLTTLLLVLVALLAAVLVTPAFGAPSVASELKKIRKQIVAVVGLINAQQVLSESHSVTAQQDANGSASGTASCFPSEVATGGGAQFQTPYNGDSIIYSRPMPHGYPRGWSAAGFATSGNHSAFVVYVVCAKIP